MVFLHPIEIMSQAATRGEMVEASIGMDRLRSKALPRQEGSELVVNIDDPTGCWVLLPSPAITFNARN